MLSHGSGAIPTSYFNLRYTFECANPLTFFGSYNTRDNSLLYPVNNSVIKVKSAGNGRSGRLSIIEGPSYARREIITRFRLKDGMEKIYKEITTDSFMREAIKKYKGMRVTLNDPWEATLCFIISQYNNVKRIRKITTKILDRFGSDITNSDGRVVAKSFPGCADIAKASIKELAECGAGFRSRYIKESAEYCTNNIDLRKLGNHDYQTLKGELMEMRGVGDKVADCIALMGYGKLEAFPIDVWVKRTMERIYFKGRGTSIRKLHEFAEEKFGQFGGYAQEYIFWFGRNTV